MKNIYEYLKKNKIITNYWILIFYIPFFVVISIFSKPQKKDIYLSSVDKSFKKITVLTLSGFIDSKFLNVLPYIEPAGLDHFSYHPSRIKNIQEEIFKVYGYDILEKDYNPYKDCDPNFRRGVLNKCFGYKYWNSLTSSEWRNISKFTNVNYVLTEKPLPFLKSCSVKSDSDKEYFFYVINNKQKNCPIIYSK